MSSLISQAFLSPTSFETTPNNKTETFQNNLTMGQPVMVKLPQIGIVPMTLTDTQGLMASVATDSNAHQHRISA